jgi:thiol-disulfide isomerase/thioredoxin
MKQNSPSLAITFLAALLAAAAGFLSVYWQMKPAGDRPAPVAASGPASPTDKGLGKGLEKLVVHATPREVADVAFQDGGGGERRLSDWRGRFVLLNLWATWCAPCKVEMPALDRLQARLGGPGFEVVALSFDRAGPDAPRSFFQSEGIGHLALYIEATGRGATALKATGLPTTLLIDAEGREIARLAGIAAWDEEPMLGFLAARIAAAGP